MAYDKSVPYSFKKNGIYYFERRVPADLERHYVSRKISFSLKTRSPRVASTRSLRAASQLEQWWYHLRMDAIDVPGKHLLRNASVSCERLRAPNAVLTEERPTAALSDAVALYVRLKGNNRPMTFYRAAERACGYVIDVVGDKDLANYSKADANLVRDAMLARGLAGTSITRIFGTVRSVFNLANSELDLGLNNPFAQVYYDRSRGAQEREPISEQGVKKVQAQCRELNDDLRWLIALVSDTGLRLAEAAGLLVEDIRLDARVPHLVISEHPWRRLKNSASARLVPLVGASLWAAERISEAAGESPYAFARYTTSEATNANSASAALNKWLKKSVGKTATVHSFRHSMRDRLRAVECPADIVDQIGGWTTGGVGHGYGKGYPLEVMQKWLQLIVQERG